MSQRDELFELIGVLARRRYQAAERSYAPLGLNHTEARLLTMLAAEGGATTQDELSRRLFVDRSNAGRGFKRLEQAGYIGRRKAEADNRTNLVDITAKGREAAAEVNRLRGEMARTFFGDLTEADAATIATLLRKAL
jgi:DNA-binding MarR family transcriptional regulator